MNKIKSFIDDFRIFPRLFLLSFGYVGYDTIQWYMQLQEPNNGQSAFLASIVGVLSFILKNYSESGIKLKNKDNV